MGGRGSGNGGSRKLANLTGSPKQIKWANDIRSQMLDILDNARALYRGNKDEMKNITQDIKDLSQATSSRWFIDERNAVDKRYNYEADMWSESVLVHERTLKGHPDYEKKYRYHYLNYVIKEELVKDRHWWKRYRGD